MRVRIDRIGLRSAGKALASSLPLIAMFAGENRNVLKGEVQLVDQESGRLVRKSRIEYDDCTDFSGTDATPAAPVSSPVPAAGS